MIVSNAAQSKQEASSSGEGLSSKLRVEEESKLNFEEMVEAKMRELLATAGASSQSSGERPSDGENKDGRLISIEEIKSFFDLSDDSSVDVESIFNRFDVNKDGNVDLKELKAEQRAVVERLLSEEQNVTIHISRQLEAALLADQAKGGTLSTADGFSLEDLGQLDAGTLALLEDGTVSEEEFTSHFKSDRMSDVELEVIYSRFDWDNDGSLSPEEFEAAVRYIADLIQRKIEEEVRQRQDKAAQGASSDPKRDAIAGKGDFINQVFSSDNLPSPKEDGATGNTNKARAPYFAPLDLS